MRKRQSNEPIKTPLPSPFEMGIAWQDAEYPEGSDRMRGNQSRRLTWTHWLVKPGDALLAGYTLIQCILLLTLAKWANRSSLTSCA